jgi:hypothetical protein
MIGTASYRYVTEILAEMQDLGDEALPPLLCVRDSLLSSDINPRERFRREMYAMLDNTYAYIASRHIVPDRAMIGMVKSLNDHVLKYYGDQYGYETLDEFLTDQYLDVPVTFADISKWIGYDVSRIGLRSARWEDIDDLWEDIDFLYEKIGWENI